MYQLFLHYEREIIRGLCKLGNYKIKSKYARQFYIKLQKIQYPEAAIDLKTVPNCFKNMDKIETEEEPNSEKRPSQFVVAKMLIMQNKILNLPQDSSFTVGDNKYVVKLNSDKCLCRLAKNATT